MELSARVNHFESIFTRTDFDGSLLLRPLNFTTIHACVIPNILNIKIIINTNVYKCYNVLEQSQSADPNQEKLSAREAGCTRSR
jgi:hypothetical protein